MNLYFDCSLRTPSHATILLWVKKYGFFLLSKSVEKAEDWVVIIDESVQFGQNKLLLVYGIRHSEIPMNRGLVFTDLNPLVLVSKSSWTGDLIAQELEKLEESIGTIKYAVADQGNSIRKALKIKGIFHVYDITHCISIIVEHVYKSDPEFIEYTKKLAHLRGAQALGKNAHLLPPAQRANSRFMNLRPITDWGMAVLNFLENAPEADYQAEKIHLYWVFEYQHLIRELQLLTQFINSVQSVLKTTGLSENSLLECKKLLGQNSRPRLLTVQQNPLEHLEETLKNNPMDQKSALLCSSDSIESAFGKYKNYIQDNPMTGITNLSLSLAAFTGKLSKEEISEAIQSTRVENVKNWSEKNIGKTTLSKRLKTLKWDANKNPRMEQI
jgi:hypothetical protein